MDSGIRIIVDQFHPVQASGKLVLQKRVVDVSFLEQEHLIFSRFDSFVDRLNIIKEFFRTAQQFLKLEKVEIGGLRGKALSNRIICVHEEFKVLKFKDF